MGTLVFSIMKGGSCIISKMNLLILLALSCSLAVIQSNPVKQEGVIKCEEDTTSLTCNENQYISIASATTPLFLAEVKDACEGKTMCEIPCTRALFQVHFKCIEVTSGVAYQDNLLHANFLG